MAQEQKKDKKKVLTAALAAGLAIALAVGGGTYAYLSDSTEKVDNTIEMNKSLVDITESDNDYQIIPGTTQKKDPTLIADNTVDSYLYVEVTDETNGLVDWSIADGWTALDGYNNVYYREVKANKDGEKQEFYVLKDNEISYDKAITNKDTTNDDDSLKDAVKLSFKGYIVQKEPFGDPVQAYELDAGWDGVTTEEVTAVDDVYTVENEAQLAYITQKLSASDLKGKTIKLAKDMYLNNKSFTPISSADSLTLDGDDHSINGLSLIGDGVYETSNGYRFYWGLIARATGNTTVKNLDIDNFTVTALNERGSEPDGVNGVGTLVGTYSGTLTVDNCNVTGGSVSGFGKVGGLVGFTPSEKGQTLTIKDSSVKGTTIKCAVESGGLVGMVFRLNSNTFENVTVGDDVKFVTDCSLGSGEYVDYTFNISENCGAGNYTNGCPLEGKTFSGTFYKELHTEYGEEYVYSVLYGKYFTAAGNYQQSTSYTSHSCDNIVDGAKVNHLLNYSEHAINSLDEYPDWN